MLYRHVVRQLEGGSKLSIHDKLHRVADGPGRKITAALVLILKIPPILQTSRVGSATCDNPLEEALHGERAYMRSRRIFTQKRASARARGH